MTVHTMTQGDTRTPLAAQLKQKDVNGDLSAVDLTGLTVKFCMVSVDGITKISLTSSNVTVTDAANGKVQYAFQDADVDTAGTYFAWFVTETAGGKLDTFPADGRTFKVVINRKEAR